MTTPKLNAPTTSPASDGSATALKTEISRILLSAINGSDKTMWTDNGRYIRWGLVEREIHKAIDGKNAESPNEKLRHGANNQNA